MTLYLQVYEPTRLTTGSTRVSWVLSESGQKSIRIKIYKKISTKTDPNPWWTVLAHGFQSILTALSKATPNDKKLAKVPLSR